MTSEKRRGEGPIRLIALTVMALFVVAAVLLAILYFGGALGEWEDGENIAQLD